MGANGAPSSTTPSSTDGEISGDVDIQKGQPATQCIVVIPSLKIEAQCDKSGHFDIQNVPVGMVEVVIASLGSGGMGGGGMGGHGGHGGGGAPAYKTVSANVQAGTDTDLGTIVLQ